MKPTEQLKEEHQAIKVMLEIIKKVSRKLESGEEIDPAHLESIIDFIRTFADRCHHGKEEELLFTAMEAAGIPKEGGPIGIMLMEHEEGRRYVRQAAEGAAAYQQGDKQAGIKFAENARNYAALLTDHIDKEENILYMMADMHLSPEKQAELVKEFERVEEERIGPGKHEELHQLLHNLRDVYLS